MKTIIVYSLYDCPENYTGVVIMSPGDIICFLRNGDYHRGDGQPAIKWNSGNEYYWINGKALENKEIAQTYKDFFPQEKKIDYNIEQDINKIEDRRDSNNPNPSKKQIMNTVYRDFDEFR